MDVRLGLSLAAFGVVSYLYLNRSKSRTERLPPGPKKLPLIGNLLDMPKGFEWLTFMKWSDDYGSWNYADRFQFQAAENRKQNQKLESRSLIYSAGEIYNRMARREVRKYGHEASDAGIRRQPARL